MSYRIAQDYEYVGNDYWRWSAWLEGTEAEMKEVKHVVWILHPSFSQSRVTVEDRANAFRLTTAGWGTFMLRAEVVLLDGTKHSLRHYLKLEYPDREQPAAASQASPSGRPPTVFLSYSTEDSRTAAKLRESFKNSGYEILDQTSIATGESWKESLRRMIAQSDAVVGLVGDDEISPLVSADLDVATSAGKAVLALMPSGTSAAGIPTGVHKVELNPGHFDPAKIIDLIRARTVD